MTLQTKTGLRILLVDDEADTEPLFHQMFRHELRAGDLRLSYARSAEEAIVVLEQQGIEDLLVLSDINMPGMGGFQLLEQIRQRWPRLPVIMITAYGQDGHIQHAIELGANGFLTKPLDFAKLRSLIQHTRDAGE